MKINPGVSNIPFKSVYTISGDIEQIRSVAENFSRKAEVNKTFSKNVHHDYLGYGDLWPNIQYGSIIVTTGEDAKKYTEFINQWKHDYYKFRKIATEEEWEGAYMPLRSDSPYDEEEKEAKACMYIIECMCDFSSETRHLKVKDVIRAASEGRFDYIEGKIIE